MLLVCSPVFSSQEDIEKFREEMLRRQQQQQQPKALHDTKTESGGDASPVKQPGGASKSVSASAVAPSVPNGDVVKQLIDEPVDG